jgi:SAM-dependent methyltransferase
MSDSWDAIAEWWIIEAASDPAYPHDVVPLLTELVPVEPGLVLDLGCGDGHLAPHIGGSVVGFDRSERLARAAATRIPAVVGRAPDLRCFRSDAFDGAASVYLLDLLADEVAFFRACATVVRPSGWLVIVINHPVYTAPGSAPLIDEDGEILWRWGRYFDPGSTDESVGSQIVRYEHRSVASLLNAAAGSGWRLEAMHERALSPTTIELIPGAFGQDRIPRLLGVRWRLDGGGPATGRMRSGTGAAR